MEKDVDCRTWITYKNSLRAIPRNTVLNTAAGPLTVDRSNGYVITGKRRSIDLRNTAATMQEPAYCVKCCRHYPATDVIDFICKYCSSQTEQIR